MKRRSTNGGCIVIALHFLAIIALMTFLYIKNSEKIQIAKIPTPIGSLENASILTSTVKVRTK